MLDHLCMIFCAFSLFGDTMVVGFVFACWLAAELDPVMFEYVPAWGLAADDNPVVVLEDGAVPAWWLYVEVVFACWLEVDAEFTRRIKKMPVSKLPCGLPPGHF